MDESLLPSPPPLPPLEAPGLIAEANYSMNSSDKYAVIRKAKHQRTPKMSPQNQSTDSSFGYEIANGNNGNVEEDNEFNQNNHSNHSECSRIGHRRTPSMEGVPSMMQNGYHHNG